MLASGKSAIVGAVLCGGASRRMGRDKALVEVGSRPMIARAAQALATALEEVVLASGSGAAYPFLGLPEVADRHPGAGPLAGIEAALAWAAPRPVFALACDLPFVGEELVRHLVARVGEGSEREDAVWLPVLEVQEGRRAPRPPLCAVFGPGCAVAIARRLADGSLQALDLLEEVSVVEVPIGRELPFYRPDLFDNVNRPADLERAALAAAGSASAESS